ncbi:MAG: hypothetical protein ACHQ0J_06270 [Candidatus Dormibacterales bacterium]
MHQAIGTTLALLLLGVVAVGLWWSWRHPFIGLGLLVAGMSFHSFALMILLGLDTPSALVRVFQGWKEVLIALLTLIALLKIWHEARSGRRGTPVLADWVAVALAVIVTIYFLLPGSVLHSTANLAQRLVGFRIAALIPLMYFLGRSLQPASEWDRRTVLWLCMGAGAVVAVLGLFELFFVPTRTWLVWGVNQYTAFLGFTYQGPKGLPENFFVTLPDGTLLRRMVSTFISPLGIAYTGLLLFPLGIVLVDHQRAGNKAKWLAITALTLVVMSLLFAVTRLALLAMIGEACVLFVLLRRVWIAGLIPILVVATVLILYPYASLGPAVDRNLNAVTRTHWQWAISGNDTSATEHYGFLTADLKFDLEHPLGLGIGASTARYGQLVGTGESAVLGMFGDLGVLGGVVYVVLYALALWNSYLAYRLAPQDSLALALPIVALVGGLALVPISMTTDLWGDLSVTFLFWWAAGASVSLAPKRSTNPVRAAPAPMEANEFRPTA